jgi:hypothetical protein
MAYEQEFLITLVLTLIVEIPVVVLLVKYFFKDKSIKISKIIFAGLIATTLTLPYFWLVLPFFISSRTFYIIIGEILVILVETIIYKQILDTKLLKAFLLSLIANVASIIAGLIIY